MNWNEIFSEYKIVEGAQAEADRPDKDPFSAWRHLFGRFIDPNSPRITDWRSVYGKLHEEKLKELIDKGRELGWKKRMPLELGRDKTLNLVMLGDRMPWIEVEEVPEEVAAIL